MSTEVEATVADDNVPTESSTEDAKEEPDINLEMLPLIKEAQSQHGLRHGDYQRYRMYCSRRLGRMRKALHFTQGHRNRYQKKTITMDTITDARFLGIQLVCAERAWAMSMELKQAANTEPRKRFHLLRRLKRAGKHASDLSKLCEECVRCDVRTRLEAQAYCSWMQGNLMFEQQKWQAALDAFGQSQAIYERLAGAVPEEQRGVYLQRVDDISPNIRYCAYNIGDMPTDVNQLMAMRNVSDVLASKINLVLSKTQEKVATSLTEVGWLGKKVPVKSERLRVSLVKLQLVEGELGRAGEAEKKMEVYETILMECQDTMQIVREEITSETALFEKKKTAKGEAQLGQLRSIIHYLTHIKLTHAIHRNLLLLATMQAKSGRGLEGVAPGKQPAGKASKPEEFVRVYDILLQHVSDLADIPGLDDLTSQKENTARTFAFKAFRCYHLAESYTSVKKWVEAMGLMDRALEHVTQTLEQYRELQLGAEEMHKIDKSLVPELTKLQDTIRGRKCEVHVESILESEPLDEAMSNLKLSSKPLTERLDEFVLSPPGVKPLLATLPPNYKPIPHKPLFFDLALNHVDYPSLDHRVEKKAGGLTGFVKGLIWGSKS